MSNYLMVIVWGTLYAQERCIPRSPEKKENLLERDLWNQASPRPFHPLLPPEVLWHGGGGTEASGGTSLNVP